MFVIKKAESYVWPVTFRIPTDGAKYESVSFDAVFKRITQTRIGEITKAVEDGSISDADLCREVLIGWSGITEDEKEVPFTPGMLDRLLDVPGFAGAVVGTFYESLVGARRKN